MYPCSMLRSMPCSMPLTIRIGTRLSRWPVCRETPPAVPGVKPDPNIKPDPNKPDPNTKLEDEGKGAKPAAGDKFLPAMTQAEIDEIVEGRVARERRLLEARLAQDPKDKEELSKLRQQETERKRKAEEEKGNYDRVIKSLEEDHATKEKTWKQREDLLLGEIRRDRCIGRLVSELSAQNAIDPEDIAEILSRRVSLNEDRQVIVLDENSKPWVKAGKDVTIKDLVTLYKSNKPWAFKADVVALGAGAKGGAAGSDEAVTALDTEIAEVQKQLDAARMEYDKSGAPSAMSKSRALARKIAELQEKKKKAGGAKVAA